MLRIPTANWYFLTEKVGHRVDTWQGLFLGSGGRGLELTNSCLSSLPMFTMGLYLIHDSTHGAMNKSRSHFFWEGVGTKRKYHMVDWATVCKPKVFGGLGILNTKFMNLSGCGKSTKMHKVPTRGSQFWNSIHKLKWHFKLGAKH
jgi:hypothetical protein